MTDFPSNSAQFCSEFLDKNEQKTYLHENINESDIMTEEDKKRAKKIDPLMPATRFKCAIPFVGKDVPSRSSEFAHPDGNAS